MFHTNEIMTKLLIPSVLLSGQELRSLCERRPRPLLSAGPQDTENCGGVWVLHYYLLEPMKTRSGKHAVFVPAKSLRDPPHSHARQVACPPCAMP
jgi:hypothetical protein